MKKMVDVLNKYKLALIVALLIIFVGTSLIVLLTDTKIKTKRFENDYYTFEYDNNWNILNESKLTVKLENNTKANLNIEMVNLEDEYKYLDMDSLIDDLLYTIQNQNKEYHLISKKEDKITSNTLDGYKLLYENDSSEAMVVTFKANDKLMIFHYESNHKYFDILLDSVQNIIYHFEIKPTLFETNYKLSINTNDISYRENQELSNKISNLREYDIANQNYYVNYSLPSIFKLKNIDSTTGAFLYKDGDSEINIRTNVFNYNIYDYIDNSKEYGNIYSSFYNIKNDSSKYPDFKDAIQEYKIGNYNGYIYHVNYTNQELNKTDIENYIIAIAINKNHIFLVKIEGKNIKIPKVLLDNIKINSVKNYSSYITKNIVDGLINVELKQFNSMDCTEYDYIKVKLPQKYVEYDQGSNIYANRYFGLNYDANNDVYQYNIKYNLTSTYTSKESQVELANANMAAYKLYGDYKELTYSQNMTLNGKEFLVYDGSYTMKGNLFNSKEGELYKVYEKLLLYKLENGGYIAIVVDGNNIEVDNEILNEISNLEIRKEKYE